MRKNTEFGYFYKRFQHMERMLKYSQEKSNRIAGQLTTCFQKIAVLEKQLSELTK